MSAPSVRPFAPAHGRALWTQGLLVAGVVLSVAGVFSGLAQIDLLVKAAAVGISDEEAATNDSRQALIGAVQIAVHVGTVVAFLMWFHRVHRNLPALGSRELKYSPGWAVGGFFVPFLNLVRPFQVMREVWHGSDPSGLERDESADGARDRLVTPPLVGWWWTLFLLAGVVGNITARIALRPNQTIEQLQTMSGLLVVSDALEIPGKILAVVLVARIMRWQRERSERIRQRGGEPPALSASVPASVT